MKSYGLRSRCCNLQFSTTTASQRFWRTGFLTPAITLTTPTPALMTPATRFSIKIKMVQMVNILSYLKCCLFFFIIGVVFWICVHHFSGINHTFSIFYILYTHIKGPTRDGLESQSTIEYYLKGLNPIITITRFKFHLFNVYSPAIKKRVVWLAWVYINFIQRI